MIIVDTSVLVDAFTRQRALSGALREAIERGERLQLTSMVLFEWLRGPREAADLEAQEALLPAAEAIPFERAEAAVAAQLYRSVPRAGGREVDLAIAATAITRDADLWTVSVKDFADIPGLKLVGAE